VEKAQNKKGIGAPIGFRQGSMKATMLGQRIIGFLRR
jgi:hypothetical protein